jgi:hypothetical protein
MRIVVAIDDFAADLVNEPIKNLLYGGKVGIIVEMFLFDV